MALIIKSSIIAVFMVLGVISATSICCLGAIAVGTESYLPRPFPHCFHTWTSQYPCNAYGCHLLCEHKHHKSDKAYCKSQGPPGVCCCP
ncbi:unnamed protein product [Miscanthus lutarioriparius]|uniref:Uncharacterized protein n=1 Tax=Miscanthus lutarioriparius TaxID=422564 RepID=A0A811QL04_9POAL|nr:unnamed protein product [Miscanthus lutarioriparius]